MLAEKIGSDRTSTCEILSVRQWFYLLAFFAVSIMSDRVNRRNTSLVDHITCPLPETMAPRPGDSWIFGCDFAGPPFALVA